MQIQCLNKPVKGGVAVRRTPFTPACQPRKSIVARNGLGDEIKEKTKVNFDVNAKTHCFNERAGRDLVVDHAHSSVVDCDALRSLSDCTSALSESLFRFTEYFLCTEYENSVAMRANAHPKAEIGR